MRDTAPASDAHASNAQERSIAIVGAGPGGLAAAALLAAAGARVTIYEARDRVGGRTARLTLSDNGDDFHFDLGPTFFLMPYVLEEIFNAAGQNLHEHAELIPLDPMYRLIIGRQDQPGQSLEPWTIDATADLQEMARRIAAIHPPDGLRFPRFIKDNRAKLAAAEPILRKPIRSPLDLVSRDGIAAARHIRPHHSVSSLLAKYFDHPATRLAVSFQSKYLGMSPHDCPSLFTILPFIEYEYGIWHPKGGCNALMNALASLCIDLGVNIKTNSPVQRIEFDTSTPKPRATGLVINGEHIPCDHAVINADVSWALKNLVPESLRANTGTRETDTKLDNRKYSCSTCMLYLGIDGEVDLPHHTIYVSENYDENLQDIATGTNSTDDPSFYICNPSATDPTLAPPGKSALYILLPTSNLRSKDDWARDGERVREALYTQLARRAGLNDLKDRVRVEKFLTPDDWAGMNINHGATFNLAHNLGQMLHKRPQHKLQGFDGLWLVGGGTHPGSGLPVIFLSSQITSRLLCEELGLTYPGTPHERSTTQGALRSQQLIATKGHGLNEPGLKPVTGPAHASKAAPPTTHSPPEPS